MAKKVDRLSVDASDLVFEEDGVLPEMRTAESDPMPTSPSDPEGLTAQEKQKMKDALRFSRARKGRK